MSGEAIARVPFGEWMLAVAVLVCGAVAIAATWRCTGRLFVVVSSDDHGGPEKDPDPPLAPPPAPTNELDDVDRALWELIEAEYRKGRVRTRTLPVPAAISLLARGNRLARSLPLPRTGR